MWITNYLNLGLILSVQTGSVIWMFTIRIPTVLLKLPCDNNTWKGSQNKIDSHLPQTLNYQVNQTNHKAENLNTFFHYRSVLSSFNNTTNTSSNFNSNNNSNSSNNNSSNNSSNNNNSSNSSSSSIIILSTACRRKRKTLSHKQCARRKFSKKYLEPLQKTQQRKRPPQRFQQRFQQLKCNRLRQQSRRSRLPFSQPQQQQQLKMTIPNLGLLHKLWQLRVPLLQEERRPRVVGVEGASEHLNKDSCRLCRGIDDAKRTFRCCTFLD